MRLPRLLPTGLAPAILVMTIAFLAFSVIAGSLAQDAGGPDTETVAPGGTVPDKRMTEDEVIAELDSGMTIGIGGWGSRRKPMSLVRAILRSDLTDLHIVS